MFPPSATPPGVVASADGAMVSSPVSLVEWFLNFYDASKAARHVECICKEGARSVRAAARASLAGTRNYPTNHTVTALELKA